MSSGEPRPACGSGWEPYRETGRLVFPWQVSLAAQSQARDLGQPRKKTTNPGSAKPSPRLRACHR